MIEAINLIDDGLHMQGIVTAYVREAVGPAIIRRGVRERHSRAARNLWQWHWNRIDFRAMEIIHALAAGTIGPFVRGMLVGPGRAAAMRPDHFENGVHPQVLVRHYGLTAASRISDQVFRIYAATGIQTREIDVDRLVHGYVGADRAGTGAARIAQAADPIPARLLRPRAIIYLRIG